MNTGRFYCVHCLKKVAEAELVEYEFEGVQQRFCSIADRDAWLALQPERDVDRKRIPGDVRIG